MNDLCLQVTGGDALMFYATCRGNYTIRIQVRLDGPIDGACLRAALDRTAARYPYFCVSLRKNEREYYYEANPAPVALIPSSRPPVLGSEESNGHIWAVCYEGDSLFVDFFHGRADGAGVYPLVATLLYYYCNLRTGLTDSTGIRTLETPFTEAETRDPVDDLPRTDLGALSRPPVPKAMSLLEEAGLSRAPGKGVVYRLALPEASLLPFIRENDATPGLMVSVLLARAVERVHPDHAAPLISYYVVNARPMLRRKESFHNCTSRVILSYDRRVRSLPLERQGTVYRGKTILQSDEEAIRRAMTASGALARTLLALPDLESKIRMAQETIGRGFQGTTFGVSYVGKWPYRQLEKHIREFWAYTPAGPFPLAEVSAVSGTVFLTLMQGFADDRYYRALLEELEAHGIEYTEHGKQPVEVADIET